MSSIASEGIQYDTRDALVTSWRFTQPLQLDSGETVQSTCILQKSVIIPQYSPTDWRSTNVEQKPTVNGKAAQGIQLPPKDGLVVEGLTRETVKLRGWVFYDLPDGQGAGMYFLCHEQVLGWSSQLG